MSIKASIEMNTVVVASRDQVACQVADEVVILSLRTGEYYGLNPVAATIWRLVQEERPVAGIRDALLAEYGDVTIEECSEQLLILLEEMVASELIELR